MSLNRKKSSKDHSKSRSRRNRTSLTPTDRSGSYIESITLSRCDMLLESSSSPRPFTVAQALSALSKVSSPDKIKVQRWISQRRAHTTADWQTPIAAKYTTSSSFDGGCPRISRKWKVKSCWKNLFWEIHGDESFKGWWIYSGNIDRWLEGSLNSPLVTLKGA